MINLYHIMINKTILITGANGEIGQYLIQKLSKDNNFIIALDLTFNNMRTDKRVQYIRCSILDDDIIKRIFIKYQINIVFHLAAILSTKAEQNHQLAKEVNYFGTKFLIDQSINSINNHKYPIKFFFPSSIAVYNLSNEKEGIIENTS